MKGKILNAEKHRKDKVLSSVEIGTIITAIGAGVGTPSDNKDINIESMDTETVQAPMSGTTLFKMQAMIQIPQKIEIQALENNLTVLGESLSVELELICVN